MEVEAALAQFAGGEERQARIAYDWLYGRYRGYVHSHLIRWLPGVQNRTEIREEIVQNTFLNIWRARTRYVFQGEPQWRAFLRRTASRCCIDFVREEAGQNPLPTPEEEAAPGEDGEARGRLYACANTVLLELDPALSTQTHDRQLLAARFYYLDNESTENIRRWLPPAAPEEAPLSQAVLASWLTHPGVVRYLAYDHLYYASDQLAAHLLGLDEELSPSRRTDMMDRLMRRSLQQEAQEQALGEWTWAEVQVILWRYRYALSIENILAFESSLSSPDALKSLLARCEARFPFSYRMQQLLAALRRSPELATQEIFSAALWQRLALQYHYYDELTYEEIESRLQPAALQVNYPVRAVTMPTWLALSAKNQGRVIRRLASRCTDAEGAEFDA